MNHKRVQDLFNAAMELPSVEREPYLDCQCGDDDALRAEVASLLENHLTSAQTMLPDSDQVGSLIDYRAGDTIGKFKILNILGEGGMGMVYLAEQSEPVKRRVALKVIKAGMDTKRVVARFEAERQALAIMNHPGIAQVYEAGATDEGKPFFVMEYVKGVPITVASDMNKLNTRQRLELIAKVCDAVQHAHTKGIIHRDLKPGNILITSNESNVLEPKIIDFGVAKATSQQLTDKTIATQVGRFVGTPAYMSPEQADLKASDIDTRSDVYALGVILYELLTGRPPFDPQELRDAGLERMREIIREQDPPRPSTQLSTLDVIDATRISKTRQIQIAALAGLLRKELEWIPLKALKKVPSERYDSAKSMADDIRRYLNGVPLEAGPESASYRLKKTIRRHKGFFAASALVVFVLSAGIVGTSTQWYRANELASIAEEEMDRAEAVKEFVTTMLSSVDPSTAQSMDKELMMLVLSRAADSVVEGSGIQPLVEAEIHSVIGSTYEALGMWKEAEPHLIDALEIRQKILGNEHARTLSSKNNMGVLLQRQGNWDAANNHFQEVLETSRRVLGNEHDVTLNSINNVGSLLLDTGHYDEAEAYFQEVLDTRRYLFGNEHPDTLHAIGNLGATFYLQGEYEDAIQYLGEELELSRRILGNEHPDTLISINNMGSLLEGLGKYEEARPLYQETLDTRRRVLGEEHPRTLNSMNNLGYLLLAESNYAEAEKYYQKALEVRRRTLGNEHPDTLMSINNMGALFENQEQYSNAEPYYREALELRSKVLHKEHPHVLISINNLGSLLLRQEKYDEAKPYLLKSLALNRETLGDDHFNTLLSIGNMAAWYKRQGLYAEAEPFYRESLEGRRSQLSDRNQYTLWALYDFTNCLINLQKYEEAEPFAVECVALNTNVNGQYHPETTDAVELTLNLYDAWEKPQKAEKYRAMLTSREEVPSGKSD